MASSHGKNPAPFGVPVRKDTLCRRFFLEPHQTLHRRSEARRAVVVDQQPQTEVATRLGSTYATRRRVVRDVRAQCRAGPVPPFFVRHRTGDRPGNAVALHQLARTTPAWRMCAGCR